MNKNLDWVHHDSKTFDEEEFMEEIERLLRLGERQ